MEEDDSAPDVWYTLALAYYSGSQIIDARCGAPMHTFGRSLGWGSLSLAPVHTEAPLGVFHDAQTYAMLANMARYLSLLGVPKCRAVQPLPGRAFLRERADGFIITVSCEGCDDSKKGKERAVVFMQGQTDLKESMALAWERMT